MKFMVINSLCNNSIKSCDVHFVENSLKMQLVINVKTANTRVTKNVMEKWLRNVSVKLMLKRYVRIVVSRTDDRFLGP